MAPFSNTNVAWKPVVEMLLRLGLALLLSLGLALLLAWAWHQSEPMNTPYTAAMPVGAVGLTPAR